MKYGWICTLFFFLVQIDTRSLYLFLVPSLSCWFGVGTFVACIHGKMKISLYKTCFDCEWKYLVVFLCTDFCNLAWQEVAVKKFLDQDFSGDALAQFKSEVSYCLYMHMYKAVICRYNIHAHLLLFAGWDHVKAAASECCALHGSYYSLPTFLYLDRVSSKVSFVLCIKLHIIGRETAGRMQMYGLLFFVIFLKSLFYIDMKCSFIDTVQCIFFYWCYVDI